MTRLDFPVVQQCAQGQNDWISIAADGQPEPDSPAPRLGPWSSARRHRPPSNTAITAITAEGSAADGATVTTVTVAADGEHG
ncbi:MAG: DUF1775 domain-containing protein [Acidimicrobiales bacterium]